MVWAALGDIKKLLSSSSKLNGDGVDWLKIMEKVEENRAILSEFGWQGCLSGP
jgi:hypothetical protein